MLSMHATRSLRSIPRPRHIPYPACPLPSPVTLGLLRSLHLSSSSRPNLQRQRTAPAPHLSQRRTLFNLPEAFLALPSYLPFNPSYATTIVLLTVVLRATLTLPLSRWQRERTKRMRDLVNPQLRDFVALQKDVCKRDCRERGLDFEGFKQEWARRIKAERKRLSRIHKCSPIPTMLGPALIGAPLFVLLTLTIRNAAAMSRALPSGGDPSTPSSAVLSAADTTAAAGASSETLSLLTSPLASESLLHYPSIAELPLDPLLPLLVGGVYFLNAEVAGAGRESMLRAARGADPPEGLADPDEKPKTPEEVEEARKQESADLRQRAITNVFRVVSFAFIWYGMTSPVALNLYWLSSGLFTLGQTTIFGLSDRKEAAEHGARLRAEMAARKEAADARRAQQERVDQVRSIQERRQRRRR